MAALDLQEQEQVEALKNLWKDWGPAVVGGLLALAVGYGGVAGWKAWKTSAAEHAAAAFQPYEAALKAPNPDVKVLAGLADKIAADYPGSAYAFEAALDVAARQVKAGDNAGAIKHLTWAVEHAPDDGLKAIASLRLAAAHLDADKLDDALKVLEAKHPAEFDSLFLETRGDVLVVKKDKAGARLAYQSASVTADPQRKAVLDWKLQALGA